MSKAANEIFEAIKNAQFVWTTGVGKSAAVADLLARYLRNVGVPSAFLDATDYWHGGRGGVKDSHLVVLVSASGETEELLRLVEDCCSETVHIGKTPMRGVQMFWLSTGHQTSLAVSVDPTQMTRAVYDLVCEYVKYAGVSRQDIDANHPAGASCGHI